MEYAVARRQDTNEGSATRIDSRVGEPLRIGLVPALVTGSVLDAGVQTGYGCGAFGATGMWRMAGRKLRELAVYEAGRGYGTTERSSNSGAEFR